MIVVIICSQTFRNSEPTQSYSIACVSDFNKGCQTKFEAKFLIPELPSPPQPSMSGRARGRTQTGKAEQEVSVCGKVALRAVPILHQEKQSNPNDTGGDSREDSLLGAVGEVLQTRLMVDTSTTRTVSLSAG